MLLASDLSILHARCFTTPRPWSETEFASFLDDRHVFVLGSLDGFVLGRVIVDEAELLTIAVDPDRRRQGLGAQLLTEYETLARSNGAETSFLEVAADNVAANTLYSQHGYVQSGRRIGYYKTPDQHRIDALVLSKSLA